MKHLKLFDKEKSLHEATAPGWDKEKLKDLKDFPSIKKMEKENKEASGKFDMNIADRNFFVSLQHRTKARKGESWDVNITNTTSTVLTMTPTEFKQFAKTIAEISLEINI